MDEEKRIEEVGGRTWSELEVVQADDGHRLVRDAIREKVPGSETTREIPVMVRIPRPMDLVTARVDARLAFARLRDLDVDRDKDMFDEIEQLCLLAKAVRVADKPYPQLATWDELAARYDEGSLQELLGRLTVYRQMSDPRISAKTEEDVWKLIFAVARSRNLLPLVGTEQHEQPSLVVTMAVQATLSPTGQRFAQSLASSTPEP